MNRCTRGRSDGPGLRPVTAVRVLSGTLGDEQRRESVYGGDLLVFQKVLLQQFAMSLTHTITARCLLERLAQAIMRSRCVQINLTSAAAVTVEGSYRKLAATVRAWGLYARVSSISRIFRIFRTVSTRKEPVWIG